MKRLFDLMISFILLLTLTPFFLILLLIYVASGNRPILFKQQRLGINGSPFELYKYRTLKEDDTPSLETRSFVLGNWLRRTSLDELPQLYNVIKGEMSLVGPRPLPIDYEALFSDEQRTRFQVKPGITGLAQVNGGTQLSWSEKFRYDLLYIKNRSFWGDLKILVKTVGVVLSKKDDGLTEQPFKGEA